jgi:hypothetical protein
MAEHRITDEDATPGVGLHEWGGDPVRRARLERAAGGGLLAASVVMIVLSTAVVTFGAAPALLLVLFFIGTAMLGSWLRGHGAKKLREIGARAARRDRSLHAT